MIKLASIRASLMGLNARRPPVRALRVTAARQYASNGPSLQATFANLWQTVTSSLKASWLVPKVQNSMCKYYGHKIDHKNWSKGLPRCSECNAQIKDSKDLRNADGRELSRATRQTKKKK
ncbi:MAG: hypothetical protein K2W95_09120 [Candidatus Obscuribacterales bacterium]|nr:hypothetical protein [Candidatus Obscuribacterales bacterium]